MSVFKLCNFCLEKVTAKDAVSVKDLVIDKSPGIVQFTEVLSDISLHFAVGVHLQNSRELYLTATYFQTKALLICERCLDSVIDFFRFKENLRRHMEPTSTSAILKPEKSEIVENVEGFLKKTQEEVSVISHHNCLCLVPASSLKLMKFFIQFNPSINLNRDPLKVWKT